MGMNTSDLAGTMRDAFTAGSGVDSSRLKLTLTIAVVALAACFFGWLVMVTFDTPGKFSRTFERTNSASSRQSA